MSASLLLELLQPTIESVLQSLANAPESLHSQICTRALVRACATGNAELLEWLLDHQGHLLQKERAVDDGGCPALILAVLNARGDLVRVLLQAGFNVDACDASGWTALHWCAHSSDLPTAAYLLNRGASTSARSNKGLRPIDLAKHDQAGDTLRDILLAAEESRSGVVALPVANKQDESLQRKLDLAHESARRLQVDVAALGLTPLLSGLRSPIPTTAENDFQWDQCLPNEMLVLAIDDLPILFDMTITRAQPSRAIKQRTLPANALFLAARFASHYGTADMFDELVFGAIEKIEDAVHGRPDDMANCAFWLSNAVVLLYYLRTDESLSQTTKTYQLHISQLVNELCVFVIRDVERRIDRMLDAAMLDYEAVSGFEDVKFKETEWKVLKGFTFKGKRNFSSVPQHTITPRASVMSLFGQASNSLDVPDSGSAHHSTRPLTPDEDSVPSPKSITSLLSSALFVLQLYEVHPLIIIQTFSQIFYWLGCELVNRVLARRKYLCRSKAMQMRLNVSAFEDWARLNHFPPKVVSTHFRTFSQLLQWLQCLSSEDTMDGLVGTMQNLDCLNPLQLKRAVKEYRYEVDETQISEECVQYLDQLEKDWTRHRISKSVEQAATDGDQSLTNSDLETDDSGVEDEPRESPRDARARAYLDDFVTKAKSTASFEPPHPLECLGEFLDSRHMLPFALPTSAEHLLAFGQGPVFGPFAETTSSTPASNGASPNIQTITSTVHFVPLLPDDFLEKFDAPRLQEGPSKPLTGLGVDIEVGDVSLSLDALADFHDWRKRLAEVDAELQEEEDAEAEAEALKCQTPLDIPSIA